MDKLLLLPGNNVCADCGAKDPKWVSINIGVFLCIQCAGVHRHLGTHISQMRSIHMDKFSQKEIENVQNIGNDRSIASYEKFVAGNKIDERSDLDARESFIRAKYEKLLFTNPDQAKSYQVTKHSKGVQQATTAMTEYTGILFVHLIDATSLIIADIISSDPYDKDDLNEDDFLGQCEVDLSLLDNDNYRKGEYGNDLAFAESQEGISSLQAILYIIKYPTKCQLDLDDVLRF